jgi:hypothetical protein
MLAFGQETWVERAAGAGALQFHWGGADMEAPGGSKAIGPVFGMVGQVKLALLLQGPDQQLASGREESSLVLDFFLSSAFLIIPIVHLNIDTKLFLHPNMTAT